MFSIHWLKCDYLFFWTIKIVLKWFEKLILVFEQKEEVEKLHLKRVSATNITCFWVFFFFISWNKINFIECTRDQETLKFCHILILCLKLLKNHKHIQKLFYRKFSILSESNMNTYTSTTLNWFGSIKFFKSVNWKENVFFLYFFHRCDI